MPESIVLDIPSLLAAASVFVSILAALYSARSVAAARRQATAAEASLDEAKAQSAVAKSAVVEAQRQNLIALHGERLGIYEALLEFRLRISIDQLAFTQETVWEYFKKTAWAHMYFPQSISTALHDLGSAALQLHFKKSANHVSDADPMGERPTMQTEFQRLFVTVEKLNADISKELEFIAE